MMTNKDNIMAKEVRLNRTDFICFLLIIGFYVIFKLPDVFCLFSGSSLVHYADFEIHARLFLGDGWLPRTELKNLYISPAAPFFIIPPGLYYINKLIQIVFGNSYLAYGLATFLFQLLTPVCTYYLSRHFLTPVFSFILGIISAYFFVNINILPDFWIQPILLFAFIFFVRYFIREKRRYLMLAGVMSFLIIFLKHNIGINFLITLSTALLVANIKFYDAEANRHKLYSPYFFFLFLAPILIVFIKYLSIYLYFDEFVFYLLPSLILFAALTVFMFKNRNRLYFNVSRAICELCSLGVPVVFLVSIWFIVYSFRLGFSKYIFSLFGIGPKYLYIWDYGIVNFLKIENVTLNGFAILLLMSAIFNRTNKKARNITVFFAVAWLLAGISQWKGITMIQMLKNILPYSFGVWDYFACIITAIIAAMYLFSGKNINSRNVGIMTLPVIGMLMYFPLESGHILLTKSILFWIPIFIYFQSIWARKLLPAYFLIGAMLLISLFLIIRTTSKYAKILTSDLSYVQVAGKKSSKINVLLPKYLSRELTVSLSALSGKLNGNDFLTLDSSSTLREYYSFLDISTKNEFIETRTGLTDGKVVSILKNELDTKFNFILVNNYDYEKTFVSEEKGSVYPVIEHLKKSKMFELIYHYVPSREIKDVHIKGYRLFKKAE
jgi:hypothetical protein